MPDAGHPKSVYTSEIIRRCKEFEERFSEIDDSSTARHKSLAKAFLLFSVDTINDLCETVDYQGQCLAVKQHHNELIAVELEKLRKAVKK